MFDPSAEDNKKEDIVGRCTRTVRPRIDAARQSSTFSRVGRSGRDVSPAPRQNRTIPRQMDRRSSTGQVWVSARGGVALRRYQSGRPTVDRRSDRARPRSSPRRRFTHNPKRPPKATSARLCRNPGPSVTAIYLEFEIAIQNGDRNRTCARTIFSNLPTNGTAKSSDWKSAVGDYPTAYGVSVCISRSVRSRIERFYTTISSPSPRF